MKRILFLSLILILALWPRTPAVRAQVDGPVYIVQEGDSYWAIADTFKVTIPDLLAANGFGENHIINPGDRMVIPGYEGIQGILSTRTVELGETLATLSLSTGIPADILLRLNRLVNPQRLYAGQTLIVVAPEEGSPELIRRENGKTVTLAAGTPLLAAAAAEGANPWELAAWNGVSSPAGQFSGQNLLVVGGDQPLRAWPAPVEDIQFKSLPLVQGETGEVILSLSQEAQVEGTLGEYTLHFQDWNGQWVSLQGIHGQAKPQTYPFTLTVALADGRTAAFQQDVLVISGNYPTEPDLKVPPETLDPATIDSESEQVRSMVAPFTQERYWDDLFLAPANKGITSLYGNRRSYNNGAYYYFHTGVDYAALEKDPFYAPAAGRVIFTGPLTICGNTTILDHGWGVYSRFCHQQTIKVQVGEMVQPGQEIGLIGHTGRAAGPHLHWEIWVGGIQVNPLTWTKVTFP
ncbi:MAG: peptidoglycan DD-metalloendopeptidase family protein [Anaerolineales bacterium]|nr:peptidoglycan DD-metalloendopeptidase family protein [Anaerolineales bacterium]